MNFYVQKTLVVFTYAPAGLGHIRVANALMGAIPPNLKFAIFSPTDKTTEAMHRFSSINTFARKLMEFTQKGIAGYLYTKIYVKYLKTHTDDLITQFIRIVLEQDFRPEKVIIISTHFGLAYQLGVLKDKISRSTGAKIFLVVQVTDDSPQDIWYVDSADLIICPSEKTKKTLAAFGKKHKMPPVPMIVVPYPISLEFSKELPLSKIENRLHQLDPQKNTEINIIIPVSGAAVGMEFFAHIMHVLHEKSPRFVFHIVCRSAPFTKIFLRKMAHRTYVRLHVSSDYKEVVEMYKKVYEETVISSEITKPSEQAFKGLLGVHSVGGSYLFLAEPVGRQEYDNIDFLKRHRFVGTKSNTTRGWILPHGSKASAELIWKLYSTGVLKTAFENFVPKKPTDDVSSDGAKIFWEVLFRNL